MSWHGRARKSLKQFFTAFATLAALSLPATAARAQGHAYVNMMRSSTTSYFYMEQSVEGEWGKYTANVAQTDADGSKKTVAVPQTWKGYGIGTSFGLEMLKFVQVEAGHTFVNVSYRDDALQSLSGSRLHAGGRIVFTSPAVNFEAGAGVQGSRLDYRKQLEEGEFYGSGTYYSLGLNYFLSSHFSVYYQAKTENAHLERNSGQSSVKSIETNSTLMGLGFRLWL